MKKNIVMAVLILFSFILISCSDSGSNPVAAALSGDTKLKDGDRVPFLLEQNYPNPFNPATNINFSLTQNMYITLKVYTEDWQEVTTIFARNFSAGPYMTTFNGIGLASGVYYYVMKGNGYTQIRAMRLVK